MIKPEQRKHIIKVYVTKTQKGSLKHEARKRGISVSALLKVGIFEYLSPRLVPNNIPIIRIDRTPKGSKEPIMKNYFRECIDELKIVLEIRRNKQNE
jgi:hypothetical protein